MQHVLAQLARLSGQPMLISGDAAAFHSARFAGLLRRALSAQADNPLFEDIGDRKQKPWEAREQVRYVGSTAIIPVIGTLAGGLDPMTAWWMDCCRYEAIQAAAKEIAGKLTVRAVVLDVKSPGGYVVGLQETAQVLTEQLPNKLRLSYTSEMNCSSAYWLSCACQRIIAAPSATVANIGAMCVMRDYSKMFEEAGVSVKVYKTGKYKGAGVLGTSLTPEQEQFMQDRIDEIGAKFLADVQAARPQASTADMQGQWYTGEQAVARGLADTTAINLDELLEELAAQRV